MTSMKKEISKETYAETINRGIQKRTLSGVDLDRLIPYTKKELCSFVAPLLGEDIISGFVNYLSSGLDNCFGDIITPPITLGAIKLIGDLLGTYPTSFSALFIVSFKELPKLMHEDLKDVRDIIAWRMIINK